LVPDLDHRRGQGAVARAAHAQGRLPRAQAAHAERGRAPHARAGRDAARAPAGGRSVKSGLRRSLSSLKIPNYRRYFAGQVISISGNWMQTVAEMWLVVRLTNSGVAVGVTAALQFLPVLFLGAYGGVLADRFDKRRL